jgi:hypothetical protein
MLTDLDLMVDPTRMDRIGTGVYVRARAPDGTPGSWDIMQLDAASLKRWLRSRGGENDWAEGVVALLLGHPVEFRTEGMKTSS